MTILNDKVHTNTDEDPHCTDENKRSTGLRSQLALLAASRGCYTISQWVMLTVVIRFGDAKTAGVYVTAIATTTLVFRFTEAGFDQAVTTDLDRKYSNADYQRMRNYLNASAFLFLVLFSISWYGWGQVAAAAMAVAATKLVESQTVLTYGIFRRANRIDLICQSLFLRGIFGAIGFSTVFILSQSIVYSMVCLALIWWLISYAIEYPAYYEDGALEQVRSEAANCVTRFRSLPFLKEHAPLAVVGLLAYSLAVGPTLLLERLSTLEVVGVYAALYYPFQAGNVIINSIGEVLLQPMAKSLQRGDVRHANWLLARAVLVVFLLGMIGIVASLFIGSQVLHVLYGSQYQLYATHFSVMAIAWTVRYVAVTIKLGPSARRAFRSLLAIHAVAAAPLLIVGPPLIAKYELTGAIMTVMTCHSSLLLACVVTHWIDYRRQFGNSKARSVIPTAG